jgi:hypothetical protein
MAKKNSTTPQAKASATKAEDRPRTTTIPPQPATSSPESIHYPRYFVLTMIAAGQEALSEWLKASGAPEAIIDLFDAIDTLQASLESPAAANAEGYARAFRDIAIGKQLSGISEWPEFNLQQPEDEEARDE